MVPALFLFLTLANDVKDLIARNDLAAAERTVSLSSPTRAVRRQRTENRGQKTDKSALRSPTSVLRRPTSVGLFEKTSFASNASGSLSGQARPTTGFERLKGK